MEESPGISRGFFCSAGVPGIRDLSVPRVLLMLMPSPATSVQGLTRYGS
jgi:hypothetical protein